MHRASFVALAVAGGRLSRAAGFLSPLSRSWGILCRGGSKTSQGVSTMSSADDKTLYALGAALATQSEKYRSFLSEAEAQTVLRGYSDAFLGKKLEVDLQAHIGKVNDLLEERAKAEGAKAAEAGKQFLAAAAAEAGSIKTKSGLVYQSVKEGAGAAPKASDTVTVHYHGTLADGTVFDSSVDRGQPASFPLEGVIKGWTEGLQLMKLGGKCKLTIPPELAYGDSGAGSIPPASTLQFIVELLEIK